MIFVIVGIRVDLQSLRREVGIGSRSEEEEGEFVISDDILLKVAG